MPSYLQTKCEGCYGAEVYLLLTSMHAEVSEKKSVSSSDFCASEVSALNLISLGLGGR